MIFHGVDVKTLQYEENAKKICTDTIDLKNLIETHLMKRKCGNSCNCIMVNLEKDTDRYDSTVNELKKVSFNNFVHLKGTYWRDRPTLERDLSYILNFIKKGEEIKIDEFSEVNDKNVHIQGGPLGCYCSHVRAMIYGYLNFDGYTIIVEDDISITNTKGIERYLKQIPADWDIIYLGSAPKNREYKKPFYKFKDHFHSSHFYIINNKCLPFVLDNMYPITDQVDVLVSDLVHKLKIYNITDTVYQKNIETNTQNNLHVIFNSPHYDIVRKDLANIEESCLFFINKTLPGNKRRNGVIVSNLMYDTLYEYILKTSTTHAEGVQDYPTNTSGYDRYDELVESVAHFVQCSKKGIKVRDEAVGLSNNILQTIKGFDLHDKIDRQFGEKMKAYSFGSTSHTYLLKRNGIIIKKYDKKLRWITEGHCDNTEIFARELNILHRLGLVLGHEDELIKMAYGGESLYNDFKLPKDWKEQVISIFRYFTDKGVCYPEFRLQNILALNGRLSFIDFGLASIDEGADNTDNCSRFIDLLGLMAKKFTGRSRDEIHELHSTLFNII